MRDDCFEKEDKLNKIIDEFEASAECQVMIEPKTGDNCLIPLDDGKTRGRIIGFGSDDQGDYVDVFSCDHGRINTYGYDEVFETNKEIVEFMPYTAIFGSFAGIEPIDGKSYDKSASSEIWNILQDAQQKGKLYAQVVKVKESLDWLPGIYRYDLVLAAQSNDGKEIKLLNHELVNMGLARWDDVAGPVIKELKSDHLRQEFNDDSDTDEPENWEAALGSYKHEAPPVEDETQEFKNIHENLDEEEQLTLLKMCGATDTEIAAIRHFNHLNKSAPIPVPETKAIETIKEDTIQEETTEAEEIVTPSPNTTVKKCPEELKNDYLIYKAPPSTILWQQTHEVVILSIHVGDTPDYHLEVRESYMIFAHFISTDEEPRLNIVNFFGAINQKLVSHQVRGLNIIVRLPKRFPGLLWTQLQREDEKFAHIKYNLDTMNPLDEDFLPDKNTDKEKDSNTSDDNSCDSDELFEDSDSDEVIFDDE